MPGSTSPTTGTRPTTPTSPDMAATSPIVMSYASSPPAEVIFSEEPLDTAPTGVIEAGCYRQVEYAAILDGTPYPESSGLLIDYMLSVELPEPGAPHLVRLPRQRRGRICPGVRRPHHDPGRPAHGSTPQRSPRIATDGSTSGSQ